MKNLFLSPNQIYDCFNKLNQSRELEEQSKQDELQAEINGDYGNATNSDFGFKNLININF